MATANQISFIKKNLDVIEEPVIIIGSRQYDFDKENIRTILEQSGLTDITGIDISEGEGVDQVVDITEDSEFIKNNSKKYSTMICMEVLTHVKNPFKAADNMSRIMKNGGIAVLSECYVRKISKMPVDYWRFTYDGTKVLFSDLAFDDSKAMISLTREKSERLLPLSYPLPQVLNEKHEDESGLGHLLRRLHRKFFSKGIFSISRLMPETTIYSIARKQ